MKKNSIDTKQLGALGACVTQFRRGHQDLPNIVSEDGV
jgi:hypothetical protein